MASAGSITLNLQTQSISQQHSISRKDGLTDAEGRVMDAACEVANAWAALPNRASDGLNGCVQRSACDTGPARCSYRSSSLPEGVADQGLGGRVSVAAITQGTPLKTSKNSAT